MLFERVGRMIGTEVASELLRLVREVNRWEGQLNAPYEREFILF